MHHSLKLYSRHRELFLKYYIFQAKWTRIPLIGRMVRATANLYGKHAANAYLLTTAEAERIVEMAQGLALGPCTCRKVFNNCDKSIDVEIMVGLTRNIFIEERPEDYREITAEEAKRILRQCHEQGLIHTLLKCREDFYSICNCCTCCCVPLRLNKQYGIGSATVRDPDIVERFGKRQPATSEQTSAPSS
jgi:hypothetical protein